MCKVEEAGTGLHVAALVNNTGSSVAAWRTQTESPSLRPWRDSSSTAESQIGSPNALALLSLEVGSKPFKFRWLHTKRRQNMNSMPGDPFS